MRAGATSAQRSAKKSQTRRRPSFSKFLVVMMPSKRVQHSPFPRIHIHKFSLVSDLYNSEWENPRKPCPGIKKVYMVVMKPDFAPRYEDSEYKYGFIYLSHSTPLLLYLRLKVSRPSFKRRVNEHRAWLGLKHDKEVAQYGICTTPSLARYLLNFQTRNPPFTNSQSH